MEWSILAFALEDKRRFQHGIDAILDCRIVNRTQSKQKKKGGESFTTCILEGPQKTLKKERYP